MMSTTLLQHGLPLMATATALSPPRINAVGCRVESSFNGSPIPQIHTAAPG
jgi:hypothetical protein